MSPGRSDDSGPLDRRAFTAAALAAALSLPQAAALAEPTGPSDVTKKIAILLYPGMTALDVVGPQNLLAGLGPIELVAARIGPVASDTGLSLVATHDFETCTRDLDVLLVPGGDGTPAQMRDGAALAFLADRAQRATWVTSVCTGSLILGAAGLLRGYRATSHWCVRDTVLPLFGAEPVDSRVVFDRNRVTSAGVSAGLDFALALAARLRGEAYAKTAQLVAAYAPQPPFAAGTPAEAGAETVRAADAILADLVAGARAAASGR
ncbi:transcriptional regulator GlxA family with amidase domain [Methylorubrum rhodinum]|uniref:Transcriptional regulator GlxA family with amidase domain n=1 Tax=Methylorubrum rhodinum TaxID=29428 RepID=A0A840ZSC0_9HYPH|nr:DJ-1/PfpI family protein [Methylorubrum rhodinum]MBB5759741.1 transcriptional regulator GlxA family with amidase domain [Methylorubrum rhodinum]